MKNQYFFFINPSPSSSSLLCIEHQILVLTEKQKNKKKNCETIHRLRYSGKNFEMSTNKVLCI